MGGLLGGGGKGFVSPLQNYWGKLLKMFRELGSTARI